VRDHHDGEVHVALEGLEEIENGSRCLRSRALVASSQKKNIRFDGEGAGYRDSLFLASGQRADRASPRPERPTRSRSSATRGAMSFWATPDISSG
jgi:hypothetical protein